MGLNTAAEAGRVSLAKWQLGSLIGLVVLATGASGTVVWKMAQAEPRQAAPRLTPDEARLLAKAEEEKARQQAAGKRLKQSELGAGYQIDGEGNLTGPSEGGDLPANKSLDEVGGGGAEAIARGIRGRRRLAMQDEEDAVAPERYEAPRREEGEEKVQRSDLEKPMLGYSTVKNAKWAARHLKIDESAAARRPADHRNRCQWLRGRVGQGRAVAGPSQNRRDLELARGFPTGRHSCRGGHRPSGRRDASPVKRRPTT